MSDDKAQRRWRVGVGTGRTIYDEAHNLIGMMDSPELAGDVVQAINTECPTSCETCRRFVRDTLDEAEADAVHADRTAAVAYLRREADRLQSKSQVYAAARVREAASAIDRGEHRDAPEGGGTT